MSQHELAPADAREAFADGWAQATASHPVPMTPRARAACLAAMRVSEASPQPATPTLQLGQLEGIWAVIYARREAVEKLHAQALTDVLDAISRLDWGTVLDQISRWLLLDPAMTRQELQTRLGTEIENLISGSLPNDVAKTWRAAMSQALIDATAEGQAAALGLLGQQVGISIDWNLAANDAKAALAGNQVAWDSASGWIAKQTQGLGWQVSQKLATLWDDGASRDDMLDAISSILGSDTNTAAALLDTAIGQALSVGALRTYSTAGLGYADYITAGDERVCFPRLVKVATPDGERPIAELRVGDLVNTPDGPRAVTATMKRPYVGTLVCAVSGQRTVVATSDHPFMTTTGWKSASRLTPADVLKTTMNQDVEVDRLIHFRLADPDDTPTAGADFLIPTLVSLGVNGMPIVSVDLQRDTETVESEINTPSADPELLPVANTETVERLPHHPFRPSLSSKAPVASETTERSLDAGTHAPYLPTGETGRCDGWAAARLTTERPVEVLLGPEPGATPPAFDVFGECGPACIAARRVPVSHARLNVELVGAHCAGLGDPMGSGRLIAGPSAPAALPVAAGERVELQAATNADAGESRSGNRATCSHTPHSIEVYDITVEEQHVFYAEGFLVHNCYQCETAEIGSPYQLGQAPIPPLHVRCRCTLSPSDFQPTGAVLQLLAPYDTGDVAA